MIYADNSNNNNNNLRMCVCVFIDEIFRCDKRSFEREYGRKMSDNGMLSTITHWLIDSQTSNGVRAAFSYVFFFSVLIFYPSLDSMIYMYSYVHCVLCNICITDNEIICHAHTREILSDANANKMERDWRYSAIGLMAIACLPRICLFLCSTVTTTIAEQPKPIRCRENVLLLHIWNVSRIASEWLYRKINPKIKQTEPNLLANNNCHFIFHLVVYMYIQIYAYLYGCVRLYL